MVSVLLATIFVKPAIPLMLQNASPVSPEASSLVILASLVIPIV